jgi:hypothetical protein
MAARIAMRVQLISKRDLRSKSSLNIALGMHFSRAAPSTLYGHRHSSCLLRPSSLRIRSYCTLYSIGDTVSRSTFEFRTFLKQPLKLNALSPVMNFFFKSNMPSFLDMRNAAGPGPGSDRMHFCEEGADVQ